MKASDLEKFRIFGGVKDLFGGFVFSKGKFKDSQLFGYILRCFAYRSWGFHASFTLLSRIGFV